MNRFSFAVVASLCCLGLATATGVSAQERPAPDSSRPGPQAQPRSPSPSPPPASSPPTAAAPSSPAPSSGSSASGSSDSSNARSRARAVPRGSRGAPARSGPDRSVIIPMRPGSSGPAGPADTPSAGTARPRGDRPTTGRAIPRSESPTPDLSWRRDPYWAYGWYQYDRWMPFYYGPWGGYFYYDPFWWDYSYYGYPGYYRAGGYGLASRYDYDHGNLRLRMKPRHAHVYVNGYFAGVVDDYDGVFQRLRLKSGGHRIEVRADGFEPAVFDVLIVPGDTVTYRTDLVPQQPR
jgi:hypothetical protein